MLRHALICTCLFLPACAPAPNEFPPLDAGPARQGPAAPADSCGAAGLQVLVGQDVALFESQARSGPSRILRPGERATADFAAERVNVTVDGAGRITGIACG